MIFHDFPLGSSSSPSQGSSNGQVDKSVILGEIFGACPSGGWRAKNLIPTWGNFKKSGKTWMLRPFLWWISLLNHHHLSWRDQGWRWRVAVICPDICCLHGEKLNFPRSWGFDMMPRFLQVPTRTPKKDPVDGSEIRLSSWEVVLSIVGIYTGFSWYYI